MAYKMSNAPLQAKLEMVKGPKGEMVPKYAVDGKGANDAAPTKMMKNPVTKMAKSMAYASYKAVGKQVTDPPKKTDAELQYDYKLKQAKETIATDNYLNSTVGGKKMKDIHSQGEVPKTTSFDGINYNLGYQDGSGSHYYAEGYSSKHGKKGTISRPNDRGHYHVSREVMPTIDNIKTKQANVSTPSSNLKPNTTPIAKPTKPTKKQSRRNKRADRLEARANKLRG